MTNVGWNLVLFRAATFKYIFKYGEKKSLPKKFKYGLSNFCDRGEEKACPSQIQMEIIETKPEVLDWSRHKTYGKGRKRSQIFWCFRDQISPNMKQFENNFKNVPSPDARSKKLRKGKKLYNLHQESLHIRGVVAFLKLVGPNYNGFLCYQKMVGP